MSKISFDIMRTKSNSKNSVKNLEKEQNESQNYEEDKRIFKK